MYYKCNSHPTIAAMSQRIEIHDELNEESHSTVTKESVGKLHMCFILIKVNQYCI